MLSEWFVISEDLLSLRDFSFPRYLSPAAQTFEGNRFTAFCDVDSSARSAWQSGDERTRHGDRPEVSRHV